MTDEEIEKIAKRVIELQKEEGQKSTQNNSLNFSTINKKYHKKMWGKFGSTGTIESAIRTVSIYSQGERYVARLNGEQFDKALEVAEQLYELILGGKNG